ncbi:hypothetical protein LTR54_009158 [Friedmanniomyces endolithicus]|uniref:Apple domain-containing protein n=1 Tax=Friedmanniomyces endolithicus TaxID=329885 RepID=A0AAN6JI01_9PEZI|nr:hypothetical protein LTS09_013990 [Friedmanniomyces endolithicus]KAK0314613.1 hypothetical protein LTR01_001437 [Friedmanniomyces endolithicus]KAK0325088.1 hypothetical protein LTR82_004074 [Friedmanniomyces endolithicus]KAK0830859.1 hypothetical protein LTR73_003246 [Friedmanniomyces endolithicus]KAK0999413.1 hypothetical protein LTR54_009158 [Friedmanniomyces endolithicus]
MRSAIFAAVAIARLAAAAPTPQQFDFAAVLDAPSPSATGPPLTVVANATSVFSVDTASIAASVSAEVTTVATASITGASASAASTQEPSSTGLAKRGPPPPPPPPPKTTTSSSTASSSKTTTSQQSTTSTTSSTSACPTTPEAGTYCGFINPEDPCAPQPDGDGPRVTPDTVAAFEAYPEFHSDALKAITPAGYVETFKDLNGSTSANSYITFKTLTSYSVSDCAKLCDNTTLCTAFNIYIERDPSLNPTLNDTAANTTGQYCPNPSSITNYKCSLWGSSIDATSATNYGDYREQFQVVIVASNGYDKTNNTTPAPCPGYEAPSNCTGAISSGGSYCLGSHFFPGPYDPSVCGIYAQAQTDTNKAAAKAKGQSTYVPSNMFNAYMVKKNSVAQGTYCSLFNTVLSSSWASFEGGWAGQNYFGIESSWTYALSQQDDGKL